MVSILTSPIYTDVRNYYGDAQTPEEIRNMRQSSADAYMRMGTPVLLKKRYNAEDVELGVAVEAASLDPIYGQATYATDTLSYGVGYCSLDTQPGEWYNPTDGSLVAAPVQPSNTVVAPRYRGYGPGFLTYAILPDRPEDAWKLTPQGALIRQQTAMVQLPWWPQVGDNDLLITVQVAPNGYVTQAFEFYQLKMVTPITMRGLDRGGNREFAANAAGNRFWVGQQAEMVKIPSNDITCQVEIDR